MGPVSCPCAKSCSCPRAGGRLAPINEAGTPLGGGGKGSHLPNLRKLPPLFCAERVACSTLMPKTRALAFSMVGGPPYAPWINPSGARGRPRGPGLASVYACLCPLIFGEHLTLYYFRVPTGCF